MVYGGYGLSIATAVAVEAIVGADKEDVSLYYDRIPPELYLSPFDILVVNFGTLIRNIVGSVPSLISSNILQGKYTKEVTAIVLKEISIIEAILDRQGKQLIVVAPDYSKTNFIFKEVKKITRAVTLNALIKEIAGKVDIPLHKSPKFGFGKFCLLLSHISLDLLNITNMSDIKLLESHTGKVIKSNSFNKKYRKSTKDYSFLPMNSDIMFLLGDSSGLLHSFKPSIKTLTYEILLDAKVTPRTKSKEIRRILLKNNILSDFIRGFKDTY